MPVKLPPLAIRGLVIALALGISQAFAATSAKQVAEALVAAATADGSKASYTSAIAAGADVTITGFTAIKGEETTSIPTIVVSGATMRPKGGFNAAKITIPATSATARGETIAWQSLTAENAIVPSAEEVKAKAHFTPFTRIAIDGITLTGRRFPAPVTVASFEMSVAADAQGNPTGFDVKINGIKVTTEFFAKNNLMSAYLRMLSYTEGFDVSIAAAGTYENATDTLTLSGLSIDTSGVGKLTVSGKFSGVSLRKVAGMQMQEVQSVGKLENLIIRFDNEGIVERLLAMQAKTQSITPEEAADQASAALGFFLLGIDNEKFTSDVVSSVTAFLKSPKSITISATPKEPVAFATLFDVLGDEPDQLPDVAGVDVRANN